MFGHLDHIDPRFYGFPTDMHEMNIGALWEMMEEASPGKR
jgi:hypothetical protein